MIIEWKKRFIVNLWKWIVILMREAYHQLPDIIYLVIVNVSDNFRELVFDNPDLLIEELREDDGTGMMSLLTY